MNVLDAIDLLKSGMFEEFLWINILVDGRVEGNLPRQKALFRISTERGFDVGFNYIGRDPIRLTSDIEGAWEWALWTRLDGGQPIAMEPPLGFGRAHSGRDMRGRAGDVIQLLGAPL